MAYLRWSTDWPHAPIKKGDLPCPYYLFWDCSQSKHGREARRNTQVLTAMILERNGDYIERENPLHFPYKQVKKDRQTVLNFMGVLPEEKEAVNAALDKFVSNVEKRFKQ